MVSLRSLPDGGSQECKQVEKYNMLEGLRDTKLNVQSNRDRDVGEVGIFQIL